MHMANHVDTTVALNSLVARVYTAPMDSRDATTQGDLLEKRRVQGEIIPRIVETLIPLCCASSIPKNRVITVKATRPHRRPRIKAERHEADSSVIGDVIGNGIGRTVPRSIGPRRGSPQRDAHDRSGTRRPTRGTGRDQSAPPVLLEEPDPSSWLSRTGTKGCPDPGPGRDPGSRRPEWNGVSGSGTDRAERPGPLHRHGGASSPSTVKGENMNTAARRSPARAARPQPDAGTQAPSSPASRSGPGDPP